MSSRLRNSVIAAVAVVLALAAAWFVFIDQDEPDAVSLDAAVATVEGDGGTTTPAFSSIEDLVGEWAVDNERGEFDYESATGTFVGFRVDEELVAGATTAVGRTGDVVGSLALDGTTLTTTTIQADLSTLTTNDSRRDRKARGALETGVFPMATFVLTEPVDLGGSILSESISVEARGDLTVHGVTRPVTVALDARLVDDTIVVVGSTEIVFADYDVTPPSAAIVVSIEEQGILEFQLLFTKTA